MKKIAIMPGTNVKMNDEVFKLPKWGSIKSEFEKRNIEFHTLDKYDNWEEVDWIICDDGYTSFEDYAWLERIWKNKMGGKLIYLAEEPEVVDPRHSEENIIKLLKTFPYITIYNPNAIGERIFVLFVPTFPYNSIRQGKNFSDRNFLVNISGNKNSNDPKELYSERLSFIKYCEDNNVDFTLYGTGWNSTERPSYRGTVEDKLETYGNYKFALCLENSKDIPGYITEKIMDCFAGNIIPIYAGAKEIGELFPKDLYVDYFAFKSRKELIDYLQQMSEDEWNNRILKTREFIENGGLFKFTAVGFVDTFINLFSDKPYIEVSNKNNYRKVFILRRLKMIKDRLNLGKVGIVVKVYRKLIKPLN